MEQATFIEDSIPEDQSPRICEKRGIIARRARQRWAGVNYAAAPVVKELLTLGMNRLRDGLPSDDHWSRYEEFSNSKAACETQLRGE